MNAPTRVNIILGIPKTIIILLSSPCLKKLILPMLPKICKNATKTKAVLKSTNNNASGRKMVDEPKPAIVPKTSEKNAIRKNIFYFFWICFQSQIPKRIRSISIMIPKNDPNAFPPIIPLYPQFIMLFTPF